MLFRSIEVSEAEDLAVWVVMTDAPGGVGRGRVGDIHIADDSLSDEVLIACRFDNPDELVSENTVVGLVSTGVDVGFGDQYQCGTDDRLILQGIGVVVG